VLVNRLRRKRYDGDLLHATAVWVSTTSSWTS